MSDQQVGEVLSRLRWDRFLSNDGYRSMSPGQQEQIKTVWMQQIAPLIYPQVQSDPIAYGQLSEYVYGTRSIPVRPYESGIMTPSAIAGFRNWGEVENSPTYRNLDYGQQQEMKSLWYQKMAAHDNEFASLPDQNRQAFYQRLMERAPGYGYNGNAPIVIADKGGDTGLFQRLPIESLWEGGLAQQEQEVKGWQKLLVNAVGALATSASALLAGPLSLINPEGSTARFFKDASKERTWMNVTSDRLNFLTESLPSFVGSAAGIMSGGYGAFEGALANLGGRAVNAALPALPTITGRIAGASVAGMVQGIGESLSQGQPWNSNLLADATLGVGFELATRMVGAFRTAYRAAKELGVPMSDMVRPAMDVGRATNLSPELAQAFNSNPALQKAVQDLHMVDSHGFRLETLRTPQGVDMIGDVMNLHVSHLDDAIEIHDGNNLLGRFEGPDSVRIDNAVHFMMNDPKVSDIWEKSLKGKSLMEAVETAPNLEVRKIEEIPEVARAHIADYFAQNGQAGYFSNFNTVRDQTLAMDDIYRTVRRGSVAKAASNLQARGIEFDGGGEGHQAAVAQLRAELDAVYPESPYFIVNASGQGEPRIVNIKDVPVVLIEDPLMRDPTMVDNVMVGDAATVRKVITNLRKKYADIKRSTTTLVNNGRGTITRLNDSDIIELRMSVPDGAGSLHDVTLHMPTLKQAEELLRLGRTKNVEGLIDDIFNGTDPSVRRSFDEFTESFKKSNPGKYTSDFAPFAFAVEMGRQRNLYVGALGGRYVVEDVMENTYRVFDDLNSVFRHLDAMRMDMAPSMTPGVSRSALEAVEPNGIPDPMRFDLKKVDITSDRAMGLRTLYLTQTKPTQYAIQHLENTAGGQWLRDNGLGVTKMYNAIEDGNRAVSAFINEMDRRIKKITTGLDKTKADWVYRYVEALDNPAERAAMGEKGKLFSTKSEVYDQMVEEYGQTVANQLSEQAVQARQYFDELFVRTGINWGQFVQHYMPHIRAEAGKRMGNLSSRLFDYTSGINIPEPERLAFYEMTRESNPAHFIFETDVRRLMAQYTHMAARNNFLRPVMKDLRHSLNELVDTVTVRGAIPKDYEQIVRYMGNFFDSVDGLHSLVDHQIRDATNNMMERAAKLADSLSKKGADGEPSTKWQRRMATRSRDIVSTMITWSTGAHIAGRGYSAARNLTQSLVTTGSLLGVDWWLDGLDRLMQPGQMARMERLGIISRTAIPVAGWAEMDIDSFLKKAVALGMTPFKEADAINRSIAYLMGEGRASRAFDRMQEGKIKNQAAFARQSGARLYGKANYNELADILNLAPDAISGRAAFVDRLGRLAVDRTQYLYNNFDQPQLFRHGIGKWFGQYTSWPINFTSLIGQAIGPRSGMPIADRVAFLARLSGITGSIAYGLYEAGLNPSGFLPWEMVDVGAGPQFALAMDMVKGIGGDRNALFSVITNLSRYVPYAYEGSSLWRSWQAIQDGDYTEAALHLMSAPLNYDVYPRRDGITQPVLKELYKAANAYAEAKTNSAATFGKVAEGVGSLFD